MDRRFLIGAFALLIFEILWLLADLNMLPVEWQPFMTTSIQSEEIGEIQFANQNVRRRSQGSIMWESGEEDDTLYSFDSVLTLSQSSAKLKLDGDINIQLHENTLVVLEPIEKSESDLLRLQFQRGNMRSKNGRRFKVGSGEWTIEAQNGSDLSLRSLSEGYVELEVREGLVNLENSKNNQPMQSIQPGQRLKLSPKEVESILQVSDEIKWWFNKDQRVYSHEFPVTFTLKWEGPTQKLRIIQPDKSEKLIVLKSGQQQHQVTLNKGSYYFSLEGDKITSESLGVHVWPAPKIRYFSPLPRDRVRSTEPSLFSWTPLKPARSYKLQFSPFKDFLILEHSSESKMSSTPTLLGEGTYYWRVLGVDEEGFDIPPHYSNPIYSLPDPLAAPKLRAPASEPTRPKHDSDESTGSKQDSDESNSPKNKSKDHSSYFHKFWNLDFPRTKKYSNYFHKFWNLDFPRTKKYSNYFHKFWNLDFPRTKKHSSYFHKFWNIVFPKAHAQETSIKLPLSGTQKNLLFKRKIIFSWYPVPEADHYIIEISSQADFQDPEVIKKVFDDQFEWDKFEEKTYYWRVAAGKNNGRMGLFSAAAKVDLSQLSNLKMGELTPGVRYEVSRVEQQPMEKEKVVKKPPPLPPPKPLVLETRDLKRMVQLWTSATYHFFTMNGPESIETSMKGFAPTSWGGRVNFPRKKRGSYILNWQYFSVTWQPSSRAQRPLQGNIEDWQAHAQFLMRSQGSNVAYGISVHRGTVLARELLESVFAKNEWLYGAALEFVNPLSNKVDYQLHMAIHKGGLFNSVLVNNRFNFRMKRWRDKFQPFWGGHFDVQLVNGDNINGFYNTTGAVFGLSW